ncbi:hypothetical protein CDIK_2772 [Cucumispora dikerogammari]|nr:hypothetical protein CDIK_2772 [Cucumispora dikerogammari]
MFLTSYILISEKVFCRIPIPFGFYGPQNPVINGFNNKINLYYDPVPFIRTTRAILNASEFKELNKFASIGVEIIENSLQKNAADVKGHTLFFIEYINRNLSEEKNENKKVLIEAWQKFNNLEVYFIKIYEKIEKIYESFYWGENQFYDLKEMKTRFINDTKDFLNSYKDKSNQEIIQVTNEWGHSRIQLLEAFKFAENNYSWSNSGSW